MQLMPHQEEAVSKLSDGRILWGGVGSGKSLTAIAYYVKNHAPKPMYIITTAKKRDSLEWQGDAAQFALGLNPGQTIAGVVTIDSWNNIGRYESVQDAFFIFDEQRLVGTGAWVKAFQKIAKKNAWILLTATPGDTWMDYAPVFVANGLYRNLAQFKREHVIYKHRSRYPQILGFMDEYTLERYRNMLLVEMPFKKHTIPHVSYEVVSHDRELMNTVVKDRWNPYEDQPIADAAELFRLMRKVSNTTPGRLDKVLELLKKHPKLIIFYNFDYELEILRNLGDVVEVGEWNGHRKNPIPETDSWVYLVQYTSGAEGWNCTDTDTTIFYSLTYSYKNFEQAMGRTDRMNTNFVDLYYYVLFTNTPIDRAVRSAIAQKKNFSESAWGLKFLAP